MNEIYSDVLHKEVLVPAEIPTSIGSGIFAQLAAGIFPSIEAAQQAMCPGHRTYVPEAASAAIYEELYHMYRRVYFSFGDEGAKAESLANILPRLREIAARSRRKEDAHAAAEAS